MIEQAKPKMSLEMRNLILYVNGVDVVKEFFINFMQYKESHRVPFCGNTALESAGGEFTLILADRCEIAGGVPHPGSKIIINTDDCLRDFHYLGNMGFQFLSEPQYKGYGLIAEFTDAANNRYMLVEERFYSVN